MFENDISEIAVSFGKWADFESGLQRSLAEMESLGNTQGADFTAEIKQVYASTAKVTKAIEKVPFLHVTLEMEARRANLRVLQGDNLPAGPDSRGLGADTLARRTVPHTKAFSSNLFVSFITRRSPTQPSITRAIKSYTI